MQEVAPALEALPAGHAAHDVLVLWPVRDEAVPAAHNTGAAPAGQYEPAGHVTVLLVAPPAQKIPACAEGGERARERREARGAVRRAARRERVLARARAS